MTYLENNLAERLAVPIVHARLDRLSDQLVALPSEQRRHRRVHEEDPPVRLHQPDRLWVRVEESAQAVGLEGCLRDPRTGLLVDRLVTALHLTLHDRARL